MSTKIYNAYRFKKRYSISKLMSIIDTWRNDITTIAEQEYAKLFLRHFTKYCDIMTIYGTNVINEMIENNSDDIYKQRILEAIRDKNISMFKMSLDNWLYRHIQDTNNEYNALAHIFKCHMCLYFNTWKPMFMIFGNRIYEDYICNQPMIMDYHYQNQCDKPENISKKAWEKRYKHWEHAIGPDFIPSNHGVSVSLIKSDSLTYSIFNHYLDTDNINDDMFPSMDYRIVQMLDMAKDYPNPPDINASRAEWKSYMQTDEYLAWKNEKTQEISSKLCSNIKSIYVNNSME